MSESSINKTSMWMLETNNSVNWSFWDGLFTPEECSQIIKIGNGLVEESACVFGVKDPNVEIRKSSIAWMFPSEEINWVFRRMTDAVQQLNAQYFKFDLLAFAEGFQFTKYHAPSGHYVKHMDVGPTQQPRKVSVSLQLNPSDEFDGGRLLLHLGNEPKDLELQQGKLVMFPSYVLHEVTPVTRGTRYSLVAWITGPAFK